MFSRCQSIVAGVLSGLVLLITAGVPVSAEEISHENPDTVSVEYSGVSLFQYYSETLDFVLMKNPDEVAARQDKMPYAYLKEILSDSMDAFSASSKTIAGLIVDVDAGVANLGVLAEQSRLEEALALSLVLTDGLDAAETELAVMEQAVETTGVELKVAAAASNSNLKQSYDDVIRKLERIQDMLDRYREMLSIILPWMNEFETLPEDITLEEILKEPPVIPDLTLTIDPSQAFVGDTVAFYGRLTSGNGTMAGRAIDLMLNGESRVSVTTDFSGNFRGEFQVPYWYIPEIDVQTLYIPKGEDTGTYLAATSPVEKLEVRYYESALTLVTEEKAFPGKETVVTGTFDYGVNPVPEGRTIDVYLGSSLVLTTAAGRMFSVSIGIDPDISTGKYVVTVFAEADGRYDSVETRASLNVVREVPRLDITLPWAGMIPGSITIEGRAYSEAGPLNRASVQIEMGNDEVSVVTGEDGYFTAVLKRGLSFGLVGTEDINMTVTPEESWHTKLVTGTRLLMFNIITLAASLILLVVLGIFLPRRLKHLIKTEPRRKTVPLFVPDTAPVYRNTPAVTAAAAEDGTRGEPGKRIVFWYRFVETIIRTLVKISAQPHRTLREFARESSRKLGPAGRYFYELTLTVEKVLYSRDLPTEADAEKSMALAQTIQKETASLTPTESASPGAVQPE